MTGPKKISTEAELARTLEHSVLSPAASRADIEAGCELARAYGVRAMVVQPYWLEHAVACLAGSEVLPVSVLAFPHGVSLPSAKAHEAERLAMLGAKEIDMVMNVSALKCRDYDAVASDIAGVVAASGVAVRVKVILETAFLIDDEIADACRIAQDAGAAFVKTSTGFGPGGATCEAVALMRRTVSDFVGVKASGGIRTLDDALKMLVCGADRIGTSATKKILDEMRAR
ncbi:deoxyribose-phosphate aldolase [Synergistaceae bacterium OttesenSCG-928-I11]|nr:deoxyribose-phosphate aldolase [Synergistaceae bacterium OttesenSCG-928-I11]